MARRIRKDKHEKQKEMVLLKVGLVIVIICILITGFLLYQSQINKVPVPEYAIAFFSSTSALILGYLFGKERG